MPLNPNQPTATIHSVQTDAILAYARPVG